MQQTGLNLIAIAIFTMTLSCLLSPILNISPFIPAATTFGILGLVTVDTLSLQNRGVTLLLDLFASAEQRQRIIHHEAGHFLTAYFLGIPVTGYTLTAWEAIKQGHYGRGGIIFDTEQVTEKPFSLEAKRLTLDRLSTVWMAGVAAEKLVYGTTEGGKEDIQQLRMALNLAGISPQAYGQKERWAQLQATNLLQRYQSSYDALVQAMVARKSVAECYSIIHHSLDSTKSLAPN
ncbi:MAG TPA: ATP-dependent Zn protease [Xenococcaceae cyanobacterium]